MCSERAKPLKVAPSPVLRPVIPLVRARFTNSRCAAEEGQLSLFERRRLEAQRLREETEARK